jgi:uncharacterized protein
VKANYLSELLKDSDQAAGCSSGVRIVIVIEFASLIAALHIVSTGALRHLQTLLPDSMIDLRRFRPNIVLDTDSDGFAENEWTGRSASIGTTKIAFSLAAPRCVMTTLEHSGLPADRSILQTLAVHNKINFDGFGNFACLGVCAEVMTPGTVSVGDALVFE